MSHWTQGDVSDFVYSLSLDFFTQLEDRIHGSKLQQKEIAERLEVSPSAVSQMLNSPPEKPELETLVKYARAVGSKVSVVLYNDDDPNNERGPLYSGIFEQSWQALNRPRDLEELLEAKETSLTFEPISEKSETYSLAPLPTLQVGYQAIHHLGFSGSPFDERLQRYLISTDGSVYPTSSSWQREATAIIRPEWNRQKTATLQPKENVA